MDRPLTSIDIDLPDQLPVLDAELALIEAHFAQLIAAMIEATNVETEPA